MSAYVTRINSWTLALNVLDQESGNLNGSGVSRLEHADQVREGQAGVQDVLNNDDVAALNLGIKVFYNAHDARAFNAVAVAGNSHKVDGERALNGAHDIGHEYNSSAKNSNDQGVLVRVVTRDLCTHLLDDVLDVLFVKQNLFNIRVKLRHYWLLSNGL